MNALTRSSFVAGILWCASTSMAAPQVADVVAWSHNGDCGIEGVCQPPQNLGPVVKVSAGLLHGLALRADGSVAGWGALGPNSDEGQTESQPGPYKDIAAGFAHSLGLALSGEVFTWGNQPAVPGIVGLCSRIEASFNWSAALRTDKSLVVWGEASHTPLGYETTSKFVDLALGNYHGIAIREGEQAKVYAWGLNTSGQCNVPSDLPPAVKVAGTGVGSLALLFDGSVRAWGNAVPPPEPGPFVSIAGSTANWASALRPDGTVLIWSWELAVAPVPPEIGVVTSIDGGGFIAALAQYDCDDNGAADYLEIQQDPTVDCNGNGLLDLCEIPDPAAPPHWKYPAGGAFNDPANWCLLPPGLASTVVFDQPVPLTVNFATHRTTRNLSIEAGSPTFDLGGKSYTLNDPADSNAGWIHVAGEAAPAPELSVWNGMLKARNVIIGAGPEGGVLSIGPVGELVATQGIKIAGPPGSGSQLALFGGGEAITQQVTIGSESGDSGTLSVVDSGSTLTSVLGVDVLHGTLAVGGGASVVSPALGVVVFSGGAIEGSGSIVGPVVNFGSEACGSNGQQICGGVHPGDALADGSVGELQVIGDYQQVAAAPILGLGSGSLHVQVVDGPSGVASDRLLVSGTAALGGGLFVEVDSPDIADFSGIPALTAGSIAPDRSEFDVTVFPSLSSGRYMRVAPSKGVAGGETITLETAPLGALIGFGDPSQAVLANPPRDAAVGDFDGDGDSDVALVLSGPNGMNGAVVVLFNDGAGVFSGSPTVVAVGVDPRGIAAGRFDSDAFPDLAVVNYADDSLQVLLNAGDGSFGISTSYLLPAGSGPVDVAAARLASQPEGAPLDLAVAAMGSSQAAVFLNLGSGVFSSTPQYLPGAAVPCTVDPTDVNGDGATDLVLPSMEGDTVVVFLNEGTGGQFSDGLSFDAGDGPSEARCQDLDGDGLPEIVTLDAHGQTVSVLRNVSDREPGTAVFSPPVHLPVDGEPTSLGFGDLENDGDQEIVFLGDGATRGARLVKILRNDLPAERRGRGSLAFTPEEDVEVGDQPVLCLAAELTGSAPDDLFAAGLGSGFDGAVPRTTFLPSHSTPVGLLGDLTGDGVVDAADLAVLLGAWGTGASVADLNKDGTVDGQDLATVLGAWKS